MSHCCIRSDGGGSGNASDNDNADGRRRRHGDIALKLTDSHLLAEV